MKEFKLFRKDIKDGYIVEYIMYDDVYEFYLSNVNYGSKLYVFGVPKEQMDMDDIDGFIDVAIDFIPNYNTWVEKEEENI